MWTDPIALVHTVERLSNARDVRGWFDVLIIVLLLAAVQTWVGVGTAGRIALPLMAALMVALWVGTDFDDHESGRSGEVGAPSD